MGSFALQRRYHDVDVPVRYLLGMGMRNPAFRICSAGAHVCRNIQVHEGETACECGSIFYKNAALFMAHYLRAAGTSVKADVGYFPDNQYRIDIPLADSHPQYLYQRQARDRGQARAVQPPA